MTAWKLIYMHTVLKGVCFGLFDPKHVFRWMPGCPKIFSVLTVLLRGDTKFVLL